MACCIVLDYAFFWASRGFVGVDVEFDIELYCGEYLIMYFVVLYCVVILCYNTTVILATVLVHHIVSYNVVSYHIAISSSSALGLARL